MATAPGDRVTVKTAFGTRIEKRAVTGVIRGDDFEVVRLCSPDEWDTAQRDGRAPDSTPYPAEDVAALASA